MKEVNYIPGDLVMTDGAPIGTKKGVAYVVTASDPNRTFTLKDGTVNKGVVTLDAVTEEDKARFAETSTWVKHIVPIKLAPQILESNGWDKFVYYDNTFYGMELNCYSILVVSFPKRDKEDISCGIFTDDMQGGKIVSYFPTEVKYCHQLQHLLFGLGLNSELKV